jgi:adenylate cyclase
MPEDGYKRKLVAILSADAVEYSRLMRDDEAATVRELAGHRRIMHEIISRHNGRVIDSPGDNLLAEFASVVDAVNGAVEIQETIKGSNADIPHRRRMVFRIGINLGDVIYADDRIYGDGVNIAARLEGLAVPGGISISGTVYEHVKNKLPLSYHYSGEQTVKNIPEPVRVYRILLEPHAVGKVFDEKRIRSRRKYLLVAACSALAVFAAIVLIYKRFGMLSEEKAGLSKDALSLSERASIAVMPLSNLNGDPEQDYFSDGITNDLITALSKFEELLVIASNTIFAYKGKPVNIENVGRELGVRYVLEGSVQKADATVRINVQLIDAATGFHIWSERYDRELKDIFAVQDEIVHSIVGKLTAEIDATEQKRAMHKKTESLAAYDYLLRGMLYLRPSTCSESIKARRMFEKAIELDPEFASAYVGLGQTYAIQASFGCTEFPNRALQRAKELALKALNLDGSNSDAHALLGFVYTLFERYDLAIDQLDRALELNPNDASAYRTRGQVMLWSGRVDDAIASLETAFRFDTNVSPGYYMFLGIGYYLKGQYKRAVSVAAEGVIRKPEWVGNHIVLTAAYAQLGRSGDAEREAREVLRLNPFFGLDNYGTVFRNRTDREKIVAGLRKAGLE